MKVAEVVCAGAFFAAMMLASTRIIAPGKLVQWIKLDDKTLGYTLGGLTAGGGALLLVAGRGQSVGGRGHQVVVVALCVAGSTLAFLSSAGLVFTPAACLIAATPGIFYGVAYIGSGCV